MEKIKSVSGRISISSVSTHQGEKCVVSGQAICFVWGGKGKCIISDPSLPFSMNERGSLRQSHADGETKTHHLISVMLK